MCEEHNWREDADVFVVLWEVRCGRGVFQKDAGEKEQKPGHKRS